MGEDHLCGQCNLHCTFELNPTLSPLAGHPEIQCPVTTQPTSGELINN